MANFRGSGFLQVEIANEDAKRAVVRKKKHTGDVLAIENVSMDGNSGQDCAILKLLGWLSALGGDFAWLAVLGQAVCLLPGGQRLSVSQRLYINVWR